MKRERNQTKATILGAALIAAGLLGLGFAYRVETIALNTLNLGVPLLVFAVGVGLYSDRAFGKLMDAFERLSGLFRGGRR